MTKPNSIIIFPSSAVLQVLDESRQEAGVSRSLFARLALEAGMGLVTAEALKAAKAARWQRAGVSRESKTTAEPTVPRAVPLAEVIYRNRTKQQLELPADPPPVAWENAGGPQECVHGFALGIKCPSCPTAEVQSDSDAILDSLGLGDLVGKL